MKKLLPLMLSVLLFLSCESDNYEKGEGRYSLMQTDLTELSVDLKKQATAFTTDDGDTYQLVKTFNTKWMETADTTYRTLIYYNKVSDTSAEAISVGLVTTLKPYEHWRLKKQPQDPVGFESAWMAKSGKYLNLGLLIKTGRVDDEEQPHSIGLAQDTVYVYPNGQRTACYRFLHSHNGVPEYYTNRYYMSILLPEQRPDTIRLTLVTYDGVIEKVFYTK
jgi:hypothetical protein